MRTCARLFACCLILTPALVVATTLVQTSIERLTTDADLVVQGKVLDQTTKSTRDGRQLVTVVRVQVSETLKGSPRQQVRLVGPGGELGDIGQHVSGSATFTDGEEVLLFLARSQGEVYELVGMAQGKYRIERGGPGSPTRAIPEPLGNATLVDPRSLRPTVADSRAMSLETLQARIRSALQGARP
jgi:hypothetical protein